METAFPNDSLFLTPATGQLIHHLFFCPLISGNPSEPSLHSHCPLHMASGFPGNGCYLASELQERPWGLIAVDSAGFTVILPHVLPTGFHPGFW